MQKPPGGESLSPSPSIARPSIVISVLSLSVNAASLLNQIVIARRFGAGMETDLYLTAIGLPNFVIGTVAGMASQCLVPGLIKAKARGTAEYSTYCRDLLSVSVLLVIGFAIFSWLLAPLVFTHLYKNMTQMPAAAAWLVRLSWLSVCCALVVQVQSAMWAADKRFIFPAIVRVLPYLGMIAAIMTIGRTVGVISMALGLLIGYVASIPCLGLPSWRRLGTIRDTPGLSRVDLRQLSRSGGLILLSTVLFTVPTIVDPFWAPAIGAGKLSHLAYGHRILIAIGNLLVLGPALVVLPHLVEDSLHGKITTIGIRTLELTANVLCLAIPAAGLGIMYRRPLIRILFMRNAFDASAVDGVAHVLPGLLIGMLGMVAVTLMFRALYSLDAADAAAKISLTGSVLYAALAGSLSLYLGTLGFAIAYAATWITVSVWVALVLARRTRASLRTIVLVIAKSAGVTAITLVLVALINWALSHTIQINDQLKDLMVLLIAVVSGTIIYSVLGITLFKMRQLMLLTSFLTRRVSGS